MPTLEWIGKSKVINHHQEVPFRVLERKYSFDENGQHDEDNGSENMIIRGDNLEALKALLPRYEGRVKCIYIDPPYNTGNEGWVYNDNVNDPKIKKWLGEVVGKEGEDLTRHDKWLCMMYPRLKLLQKLLADDGVIFISIDEIEPRSFSFNNPFGACPECFGLGYKMEFDEDLMIPDKHLSIAEGAIQVMGWQSCTDPSSFTYAVLKALTEEYHFSLDTPFREYPDEIKDVLINGTHGKELKVR